MHRADRFLPRDLLHEACGKPTASIRTNRAVTLLRSIGAVLALWGFDGLWRVPFAPVSPDHRALLMYLAVYGTPFLFGLGLLLGWRPVWLYVTTMTLLVLFGSFATLQTAPLLGSTVLLTLLISPDTLQFFFNLSKPEDSHPPKGM